MFISNALEDQEHQRASPAKKEYCKVIAKHPRNIKSQPQRAKKSITGCYLTVPDIIEATDRSNRIIDRTVPTSGTLELPRHWKQITRKADGRRIEERPETFQATGHVCILISNMFAVTLPPLTVVPVTCPVDSSRGGHHESVDEKPPDKGAVLPRRALNNRRQDSSRELRSESPPATARPLPQEVRSVIGVELTQPHTITIPTREARTHLLIRRLLIYECFSLYEF
ncbi:hypothetical protein AVEN_208040-1 [Araneus ventricosus]|uniref:Uncharacterized protein n=1 Tax=Araneus ventricosus TaxID=182803 RepID=A0A4Y2F221_ARAVE|nr:hypothetical protein AVEN_208040-1 [Araneus ventricosus]